MAVGERDAGIDLARVIGLVCMVAGHVWLDDTPHRIFYAWHMPLFFLLAGWFWRPGRTLGVEWGNRARTLLVPYAAWLVLVAVFFFVRQTPDVTYWTKELLIGGALSAPFSAFWFITALATVCLLRRTLEVVGLGLPGVTAVAGLGLAISYPLGEWLHSWPESIGTAAYTMGFVVAGEWLHRLTVGRGRLVLPALALVVAGVALAWAGLVEPVNLKQGELGTPVAGYVVAVALSWGLVVLCEAGAPALPGAVRRAVTDLAVVALPLVLMHSALIVVLGLGRTSTFLVALVVPWVVGLAVVRSPLAPVLVGVPYRRGPEPRHPREPQPAPLEGVATRE